MSEAVVKTVEVRSIDDVAVVFVNNIAPTYKIRKTASTTFRCATLIENEEVNWKKGLVYMITRYSKGVNVEMWLYSSKGGSHLAEYNGKFRALATEQIKCEPCGHAVKLRIQLPDTLTNAEVNTQMHAFFAAVDPTVAEVRGLVPVQAVTEKTTKKAVVPVVSNEVATTDVSGNNVVSEQPAQKSKSKSKAKAA